MKDLKINKSTTIKDVARVAKVSISCISKYLNNKPYVCENTKKKIANAIKELNYTPSDIARSLVGKKTNNFGLLLLDITNPFQTGIIRGIEDYINENEMNYNLLLTDVRNEIILTDNSIDNFIRNRVLGIISTSEKISLDCILNLKKINLPIIFIGRHPDYPGTEVDYITTNNYKGLFLITDYLLKIGHRNIGYVTGPLNSKVAQDRIKGYRSAFKDHKIKINENNIILVNDFTPASGFIGAEKLLSNRVKPSAIACVSDFMAMGTIDYCLNNNIKVPDDISITGFDDINFSSLNFISLTTVNQSINDMGREAVKILINKIDKKNIETVKLIIEPQIIIRNSTKPIK